MINKRKHNKHIMIESSFEFIVSSENKPILIASGHEFYFKQKNKFTENWICSKYQTHKCRATAITENNELIETRGEHNHNISAGKLEARNVIKHIKDLSERFTSTVAVASAVLPITNDLATQFALPSKIIPKMICQLYSIHVSVSGIAPACIYAFLPNKTEKTYNRFLQALIDLAPNCRPEKIL